MEREGYNVVVSQNETPIMLLLSSDTSLVLNAITNLSCFVNREGIHGLVILHRNGIARNLLRILGHCQTISRLAIKLLSDLTDLPDFIETYKNDLSFVHHIIDALVKTSDPVITECAMSILSAFGHSQLVAKELCREDIIRMLFRNVKTCTDPDIGYASLRLLVHLVRGNYAIRYLSNFVFLLKIDVLLEILKRPRPHLPEENIMKILRTVAGWDSVQINILLYKSKTVRFFFVRLQEPEWTNLHNDYLAMLLSCAQNIPREVQMAALNELKTYTTFALNASVPHILSCITLIAQFATKAISRQAMHSYGVRNIISKCCPINCTIMQVKTCDALAELCEHQTIAQEVMTAKLLKYFASLYNNEDLPWSPYRQAPIKVLFICLRNNPKLGFLYYKNGVLDYVSKCLSKLHKMDKYCYGVAIDMFETLISNKVFKRYLVTEESFHYIVNLFSQEDESLIKHAMVIISIVISSSEVRSWFREAKCAIIILERLAVADPGFMDEVILFVEVACKYKSIAEDFCAIGIINLLQRLSSKCERMSEVVKGTIELIYDNNLTHKFFKKNYLTTKDKIEDGFLTYIGDRPTRFPFVEYHNEEDYMYTSSILIADIGEPMGLKVSSTTSSNLFNRNLRCIHDHPNREEDLLSVSEDDRLSQPSTSTATFSASTSATRTALDARLQRFVNNIIPIINAADCIGKRVKQLATFVYAELGGHSTFFISPTINEYTLHILEVKYEIDTNFIPMSKIRVGSIVERAVLFKILADAIDLPCTLRRNIHSNWVWNEIPMLHFRKENYHMVGLHVVDLAFKIGDMMAAGKYPALRYCYGNHIPPQLLKNCMRYPKSQLM